ncbi:hypothetical protein CH063_08561 [Colletotrichum higginsianum]|uniref:Uncharacterized protein n=1 Tax=Colletotrichum higginsianum (strain IMI 349063) TaxID=759273 RepID=H1VA97_COLHI|nr:hypothetical protein CH063_08561 [Colletotrichum higginsianum]
MSVLLIASSHHRLVASLCRHLSTTRPSPDLHTTTRCLSSFLSLHILLISNQPKPDSQHKTLQWRLVAATFSSRHGIRLKFVLLLLLFSRMSATGISARRCYYIPPFNALAEEIPSNQLAPSQNSLNAHPWPPRQQHPRSTHRCSFTADVPIARIALHRARPNPTRVYCPVAVTTADAMALATSL